MNGMELLLHVSTHGSFYSEFWHFTYNSTKKESRTIEKNRNSQVFHPFYSKMESVHTPGGHLTFFFFFFFFFFLHNLINLLQLSILLNL